MFSHKPLRKKTLLSPPGVMVAYGTADTTIPYTQSVALCDSIEAHGGTTNKLIYPYYVHAFFNKSASDKYEEFTIAICAFAEKVFDM